MGEAADKMIEAMRAAGDRLHGWGDEAEAHAVWDGADALSIALWDRSEADRVAKECAGWLIAAEARISSMKSALEELLSFADTMVSCQDSPHRGEWDAECPLCMGELIEQADRAMIAKASAALAGGVEGSVDTPTAKAEESSVEVRWQPIETAHCGPRPGNFALGEPIYALIPYTPRPKWTVAWWSVGDDCFRHIGDDGPQDIQPTHWMPLAAPAEARELYPEWRPIETAPWEPAPGEQWMLLWNGHWRGVGRRYAGYDDDPGFCDETTEFIEPAPSHWMPLPAPPKDEAE